MRYSELSLLVVKCSARHWEKPAGTDPKHSSTLKLANKGCTSVWAKRPQML